MPLLVHTYNFFRGFIVKNAGGGNFVCIEIHNIFEFCAKLEEQYVTFLSISSFFRYTYKFAFLLLTIEGYMLEIFQVGFQNILELVLEKI